MDIVDNLVNLKDSVNIAQHENIDMFVQANPEFLDFIQENDLLTCHLQGSWGSHPSKAGLSLRLTGSVTVSG